MCLIALHRQSKPLYENQIRKFLKRHESNAWVRWLKKLFFNQTAEHASVLLSRRSKSTAYSLLSFSADSIVRSTSHHAVKSSRLSVTSNRCDDVAHRVHSPNTIVHEVSDVEIADWIYSEARGVV